MSLKLALLVVLIIVDDSLIGNGDKDLFSFGVGQVMYSVVDVIV